MSIKRWILFWFLSVSSLLFIFLFNYMVDPYEKIGLNLLNLKIRGVANHRVNKFVYLESHKYKYKAFILGSSRAMQLQPKMVEELTGYKTFNYSVYTATPEDYLAMTRHILETQNPKLIILHIDFYSFNESLHLTNKFYESPLSKYLSLDKQESDLSLFFQKVYFSLTALKDSIRLIKKNIKEKTEEPYFKDGASKPQHQKSKSYKLLKEYWRNEYKNFKISENRLAYLKEIQKLCKKHNIKLYLSLSPVSYKHYKKIQANEILKQNEFKVKSKLCKIFPSFIDFFNDNTEQYSDSKYWMDSVHPSSTMSNILTKEIINRSIKEEKFGKNINCRGK